MKESDIMGIIEQGAAASSRAAQARDRNWS